MERELNRLAAVLHQISYDAGYTLLCRSAPAAARFCATQYNRIHARIAALDPALAAPFAPLPADATAGQTRIAARALAASVDDKARAARRSLWDECLAFWWPGGSLKFNAC